jgi:L-rhamnose mutarotase
MGKRKKKEDSRWCFIRSWESLALFIVGCYVAYQTASKVYVCNREEMSLIENTMQILDHPVCNEQRTVFQTYANLNCEELRKRMSDTEAGRRWWVCMFSSISILQSSTTWVALAVIFYIISLWLRYTNFNTRQSAPVAPLPPQGLMIMPPQYYPYPEPIRHRQRKPRMMIENISESSSSDSESSSSVELILD